MQEKGAVWLEDPVYFAGAKGYAEYLLNKSGLCPAEFLRMGTVERI